MEPIWTVTLFAQLTVCPGDGTAGAVQRFRSRKVAALLAYLAFHRGQAVPREILCDLLWPEEPEIEVTRNRLRVTLASLRRQLEPPGVPPGAVLESVGNHHVRLRAETVQTDVAAFEAAVRAGNTARARALYCGPLLPAFYDEWIAAEQERLASAFDRLTRAEPGDDAPLTALPAPVVPAETRKSVAMPLYLTPFFGREAEKAHLAMLLADPTVRLITLTGPGGIGKTRLATESVAMDPRLRAFVPLADMWEVGQLGQALRQALQLPPQQTGDALSQVIERLNQEGTVRLVIDNVEQIVQGAALVIGELLGRVPGVCLLVTSRRRLDFPGEREVIVAPLPLPTGEDAPQIAEAPSVQLFLSRAQAVRPDYQLTPRNASDIGALCRLLEGVPLALELAAARAGTLTPGQIHTRLAEKINGDLGAGSRLLAKEERHRSMNAVVEWSFALLPPDLRRFFLRLSVFRGGWDVDAAEAILGETYALDYLSRLRGHSLVTPDATRFRLLETLRSWADEHLGSGPLRDDLAARHARYYRERGEAAAANVGSPAENAALDELESESTNLQAAFAHALQSRDAAQALRLALVLSTLGRVRGSLSETLSLLDQALALVPRGDEPLGQVSAGLYARTLLTAGELTLLTRGADAARTHLHAALPLAREAGDAQLTARVLRSLADTALLGDDYDTAWGLFDEALSLQRDLNDERGAAGTLNSMALLVLRRNNDFTEAARLTRAAETFYRRIGDTRMISYSVFNLGELAMEQNDFTAADAYFRESLALAEAGRDDWQRVCTLFALARTAGAQKESHTRDALMRDVLPLALRIGDLIVLGDALREQAQAATARGAKPAAVTLLAAAHILARHADPDSLDACVEAAAQVGLPPRSFQAAWDRGAAMTPESAVTFAVATVPSPDQ